MAKSRFDSLPFSSQVQKRMTDERVFTAFASSTDDYFVPGDLVNVSMDTNGEYVVTKMIDQSVIIPPNMFVLGTGYTDPTTGELFVKLSPEAKKIMTPSLPFSTLSHPV